jgi:hypothetical protein
MQPYTYQPLRELTSIRALRLLSVGSDSDRTLFCSLREQYISGVDPPNYLTFSYTWGSPNETRRIVVDDCYLDVRKNCYDALWHAHSLPEHNAQRLYWIDSICINQEDLEEKACQVARMGTTYRQSSGTLIWTGPHENDSAFLFQALNNFHLEYGHRISSASEGWIPVYVTIAKELGYSQQDMIRICRALLQYGLRLYWSRLWILQELAISRYKATVICGGNRVPLESLREFNEKVHFWAFETTVDRRLCSEVLDSGQKMSRVLMYARDGRDMTTYLVGLRDWGCYDKKDRIYGLLDMILWPEGLPRLMPSYTISTLDLAISCLPYLLAESLPGNDNAGGINDISNTL